MAVIMAIGHLSYRVAARRQSFSLPNSTSITAQQGGRSTDPRGTVAAFMAPLVAFDGLLALLRLGIQAGILLSVRASPNQLAP